MAAKIPGSVLFEAIQRHDPTSTAIVDAASGTEYTYGALLRDVSCVKATLLSKLSRNVLPGERIAFIVENGYNYVGKNLTTSAHIVA